MIAIHHKKIISGLLILFLISAALFWAHDCYQKKYKEISLRQMAEKISAFCLKDRGPKTSLEEIELLRSCIHQNTVHATQDKEFKADWRNSEKMMQKVIDYMDRKRAKPAFECSTRSTVYAEVLKYRGFTARPVTVIQNEEKFIDHVAVEVSVPELKKRILEDASFDVSFWLDPQTKTPANAKSFLYADGLVPCREKNCSWDLPRTDIGQVQNWKNFSASYRRAKDKEKSVLFYDERRFDIKKYCTKKKKWCGNLQPVK